MDYIGKKCPVCQKYFHADDDIVVCPDCGTPHHRECYESLGHCFNKELHEQGYDYQEDHNKADEKEGMKICPSCGHANDSSHFFCGQCGAPLSSGQASDRQTPPPGAGMPFGQQQNTQGAGGAFNIPFMDPLGGVDSNTDLGDGVTAGEAAKYVKQNTPYFIRVFNNIKTRNKSKFNFAAALFTGGYMMYRKMYKLGALFVFIQLSLSFITSYLSIAYQSLYTEVVSEYSNIISSGDIPAFYEYITGLSLDKLLAIYLPSIIQMISIALMIVFGICFNRMYFKHCKKQITKIKASAEDGENPETILQTKGGVNTPLAISLMVTYMIILYLPTFIAGFLS